LTLNAKFFILKIKTTGRGATRQLHMPPPVDVVQLIDNAPLQRFQREVFLLCILIEMFDGFDTQSIAFIAPSLATEWKIAPAAFGPIFSATLLGTMIGVAAVGRLADRYGRRWLTVAMVALFGLVTLVSASAGSMTSLLIYRLVAGFGLGGALPSLMSIAAEYAPRRMRSTVVAIVLWGFPLGAVVGGLLSTVIITHAGWRWVLIFGGSMPLLLVPVLILRLPESIRFLAMRPTGQAAVRRVIHKLGMLEDAGPDARFVVPEQAAAAGGYRLLFARAYLANSVLFAVAMFMSLLLTYLLVNWIPLLLHKMGLSIQGSLLGTVMFNIAGILGSFVFTRVVDTGARPVRLMMWIYLTSALAVAAIGGVGVRFWPVMGSISVAGFLLIGIQLTMAAYVTSCYPTQLRATAVGWVQAMGRLGSLLGPLAAGALLSLGMGPSKLFVTSSIAAVLAALALAFLVRTRGHRV
jgi:AAHS family 4-hydroxybenzoate transporter-like MFS transporter